MGAQHSLVRSFWRQYLTFLFENSLFSTMAMPHFLMLTSLTVQCLPHHPTQDTSHLGAWDSNSSKGASYSLFIYMVSIFFFQCLFYFFWFEGQLLWWRQMAVKTFLLLFCCPINSKPPLQQWAHQCASYSLCSKQCYNIKAAFGVFCKPQTILNLTLCNSPEEEAQESASSLYCFYVFKIFFNVNFFFF